MGERKGLNKYYPPNFDPRKIPRIRKPKNQQKKFRSMVPLRIRCNTCGNYMSEGTKINCREEKVIGETYIGIKIHRFYFKCSKCCAELILKTDSKNSSYVVESGATATRVFDQNEEEKQAEESGDVMSSLEKRTLVSKREIDVMAALDEMKSMKSRRVSVSVDSMLEALSRRHKEEEEVAKEKDTALIKSIRFGKQRRIVDEEIDEMKTKKKGRMEAIDENKPKTKKLPCIITLKKKKTSSLGLASLCHNYGADEDD